MFASRLFILTTLVACTVVPATHCWAQAYGLEGIVADNDLRWFEPADLDLDGRMEKEAGYFLRLRKTGLFISGERVEIGDPNTIVLSEQVFGDLTAEQVQASITNIYLNNPTVDIITSQVADAFGVTFQEVGGVVVTETVNVTVIVDDVSTVVAVEIPQVDQVVESPPDAYVVQNSIKDGTPKAQLGWGEEYEFGYSDGERGWLARIIDGPEVNTGGTFGAQNTYVSQSGDGLANTDPLIGTTPVDADGDGRLDSSFTSGDIFALGFGSVAVNFAAQDGFFLGLRDYLIEDAPFLGTQHGPLLYVGNVGGIIDDTIGDNETEYTTSPDDVDGDGFVTGVIFIDTNGDGEITADEVVATGIDYGDLYEFNVFFDQVNVRNRVELDGVEWMFTHELDRGHKLDRGRRDDLQLRYGVSYLRLRDHLNVEGLGSVLGRTAVDHETDNQLVGPSVGIRWRRDHGKWDFSLDSQLSLAYNIVDHRQDGIFGEELVMAAPNRLLGARTTATVDSTHEGDFSPMAELRAEARYKITKALAVTIGYKAKFIDNISRASDAVGYTAPNWSINNIKSDVFINGLTMGVEFRH